VADKLLYHQQIGAVVHLHDQPVGVVPDVEDKERSELVGIPKIAPDIQQRLPPGLARGTLPAIQFISGIGVNASGLSNLLDADHVHVPIPA
jgi:hypothetical protein